MSVNLDVDRVVRERYSKGAQQREAALCCPVDYDPQFLKIIPEEVIAKDYGCGDPSKYLNEGETVLDLGSGAGKMCFIASQVVGASGRVIGVDINDEMLEVAHRNAPIISERVGYSNVEFRKGYIQELGPIVEDNSVDVVISNCVLNLVKNELKEQLFAEIFRVLKRGGRAVISDIVSDEDVPLEMQNDPELWSGCISGAYRDNGFIDAFTRVGFYGSQIANFDKEPWQVVEEIEFRSMTVIAFKGKEGACLDQKHAVIYNGPFSEIRDDDNHVYRRGERMAVCEKTFKILARPPYRDHFTLLEPAELIPIEEAPPFACNSGAVRHPRETKGAEYEGECADPNGSCC